MLNSAPLLLCCWRRASGSTGLWQLKIDLATVCIVDFDTSQARCQILMHGLHRITALRFCH